MVNIRIAIMVLDLMHFSLLNSNGFDKNVIIFGVNDSSSVCVNSKKKDILLLRYFTDGFHDTLIM